MSTITPLGISALALLNEAPMHPYEMYLLLLERHEDRVVKVRPSSLYYAVERLHEHGLIQATGTERSGNRPERTTYAITPAGQLALVGRLREILRAPVNEYPTLPVALGEAHNEPAELVAEDLREYVRTLQDWITRDGALITSAEDREIPEAYLLAAHYVQAMRRAQRDWLDHLIHRLETKDLSWPAR